MEKYYLASCGLKEKWLYDLPRFLCKEKALKNYIDAELNKFADFLMDGGIYEPDGEMHIGSLRLSVYEETEDENGYHHKETEVNQQYEVFHMEDPNNKDGYWLDCRLVNDGNNVFDIARGKEEEE